MKKIALNHLRTALNNPQADFRNGQWESIEQLLDHKRMLVVQRTGWGKSMVYFIATKIKREQGAGPTLLISPLLSLMRNQIEAAERIGITATAINSTNPDEWGQIQKNLTADRLDLLLISPERLANDSFRNDIFPTIAERIGIFVIDEAHCISDWGHDFRPDYRRIVRVLQAIPPNVPVLATTATANDRVVHDVQRQLGTDIELIRGSLVRESIKLQNINMPSPAARMAWLAHTIPNISGSGIIYTLTQRDAERLTDWLQDNEINAKTYHAGTANREELEQQLLNNEIKVLVATVALGMGFDKPDLGFVIHYQRPASVVHYYQQVGRAGRAVDDAFGILLCGEEDDHIADFFIRSAFPPQQNIIAILEVLDNTDDGLSVPSMQRKINIKNSQITKAIKYLTVESPSPITKVNSKWYATAEATNYKINQEHVNSIIQIRRQEQQQMQAYMTERGCLMAFLQKALDDPNPKSCGKCMNCNPELLLSDQYDDALASRAARFLRRSHQPINPRKQWPVNNMFEHHQFNKMNIPTELRASEGRSLSLWRDSGWGKYVASGKYQDNHYADILVTASVKMIIDWHPTPAPEWVTCIPSLNQPKLVPDFAQRLAIALDLPFISCIEKVRRNKEQKMMENSFQQAKNLDGVFKINLEHKECSPCLLIDDMVDSRWTFTVASALLRQAGCTAVYPLALALNSPRRD